MIGFSFPNVSLLRVALTESDLQTLADGMTPATTSSKSVRLIQNGRRPVRFHVFYLAGPEALTQPFVVLSRTDAKRLRQGLVAHARYDGTAVYAPFRLQVLMAPSDDEAMRIFRIEAGRAGSIPLHCDDLDGGVLSAGPTGQQ